MYELCLCDLVRFRLGWAGGMYGSGTPQVLKTVGAILDDLDDGTLLTSYAAPLRRRFPLLLSSSSSS